MRKLFIIIPLYLFLFNTNAQKAKGVCYFNCIADFLETMNVLNTNVQKSVLFMNKERIKNLRPNNEKDLDEIFYLLGIQRTATLNKYIPHLTCNKKNKELSLTGRYLNNANFFDHKIKNVSTKSDKRLYLKGNNFKQKCGFNKIINSAITNSGDITEALKSTNFDPCCLPEISLKQLSKQENPINGFSIGVEAGAGIAALGYDAGYEFVMVQTGPDSMEVGVVLYNGPEVAASVPAGLSTTQAVLTGKCTKLNDYLGYFSTVGIAGFQQSVGVDSGPLNQNKKYTGCNSESVVSGTSMDLIGTAQTYYSKASDFVKIKGPQIKRMMELFSKSNHDAKRRRFMANRKSGLIETAKNAIDPFKRRILGKGIDLPKEVKKYDTKDFSKEGCSYDIMDQMNDDVINIDF